MVHNDLYKRLVASPEHLHQFLEPDPVLLKIHVHYKVLQNLSITHFAAYTMSILLKGNCHVVAGMKTVETGPEGDLYYQEFLESTRRMHTRKLTN